MLVENPSSSSTSYSLPIRTLPSSTATLPRQPPPQSGKSSSLSNDDNLLGPVPSQRAEDDWFLVPSETVGQPNRLKLTVGNIHIHNTMNTSTVYDAIQQKSKGKVPKHSVKVRGSKTRVSELTIELDVPYSPVAAVSAAERVIYGVGAWADMPWPLMS